MLTLTSHKLVSSLATGGEELKDEVIDKICEEVDAAVVMGLNAVLESLREKFPDVRFTILS